MTDTSLVTTSVKLTDEVLVSLDGADVSDEVQAEMNLAWLRICMGKAKPELAPQQVKLVVDVVAEAKSEGVLHYESAKLSHCSICGESKRYGTYRSGPRRGETNYSKPFYVRGIEMKRSFVRMEGHISLGACVTCVEELLPVLRSELADIEVELPEKLRTDGAELWEKDEHKKCVCGWEGCKSEVEMIPAVLGGRHPGKCPSCGAENRAFQPPSVTTTDGFTMKKVLAKGTSGN